MKESVKVLTADLATTSKEALVLLLDTHFPGASDAVFELLEAAWMFEIIGRRLLAWVNGHVI